MKKAGYIFLQVSACLIFIGGVSDIILSFNDDIPDAHLHYLNLYHSEVSASLINLDKAFIRAIGGCLVSLGIAAFIIARFINILEKKVYLYILLLIVTVAEGNNAVQMFTINSAFYFYPLACVLLAWIGGILLSYSKKNK